MQHNIRSGLFLDCYATSYLWLCNVRLCRSSGKTSSSFSASMTPWTLLILPRWNSTPDDDDFVDEGLYGDDDDNDADDLNDPLGNSRSHRSETQSHFLSIRQFSPLPIGHWTIQCVAFRAQFSRRFMFCPTHQLASVSTSVSPTVHQSGPINPFSEHCGHNFSPPRHPAIINKVPTCFLSQRALFQKIIWGNPPVLSRPHKFIQNKTKRWQLLFGEIFPLSFIWALINLL